MQIHVFIVCLVFFKVIFHSLYWLFFHQKCESNCSAFRGKNPMFQRTAKRDKKGFLSEQCKEIEENNRMGKDSGLFKKIKDTKWIFYAKMGTIKDRNSMDITEVEDIKKRWQEYTEELYKKNLNDPDNHSDVITHLQPDILGCKVKQVLGSIITNKASGSDGIPVELFLILKDDAVKMLHSICQQIWKTHQWPQDWKRSVFIPILKTMPKNDQTTAGLHLSHILAKWCTKFSKPGLNNTWTKNFQMFKLDLERAKKPEIKLPTSVGWSKKQESPRKKIYFCFITYAKTFDWGNHNNL